MPSFPKKNAASDEIESNIHIVTDERRIIVQHKSQVCHLAKEKGFEFGTSK